MHAGSFASGRPKICELGTNWCVQEALVVEFGALIRTYREDCQGLSYVQAIFFGGGMHRPAANNEHTDCSEPSTLTRSEKKGWHDIAMAEDTCFPWRSVVTASVGLAAAASALVSLLALWSFMEPNDRILVFDGHVVGATSDEVIAASLAVCFGSIVVSALLTYRRLR